MKDRGKPLDAPEWWLEIARQKIVATGGLVELGRALARLVGRSSAWHHSVLSKFARAEEPPTQELATALSIYFGLPRPFFVPSTMREAEAMQAIIALADDPSKKHRSQPETEAVRSERMRALLGKVGELDGELERRSEQDNARSSPGARLDSEDGVTGRPSSRRGPRGNSRGR